MVDTEKAFAIMLAISIVASITVAVITSDNRRIASLDCWSGTQLVYTGEATQVTMRDRVTTFKVGDSTHRTNAVCFVEEK